MKHENKWWFIEGSVFELDDPESMGLTDKFKAGGEIKTKYDPVTGLEDRYSVEYIADVYRSHYGIDVPYVFDTIKTITDFAARSFIVYARPNCSVRKHIHPPVLDRSGKYIRDRRTISFGIPSVLVEPATDKIYFYESKFDFTGYDRSTLSADEKLAMHDHIINSVVDPKDIIPFPEDGQCLVLDFNSTSTVHWANHQTKNEYFFIVYEL